MVADKRNANTLKPIQEKHSSEAVSPKLHDKAVSKKQTEIEELDFSPLIQAKNVLYQHIKNTTVVEGAFFTQQDRNHKRELVDVMRRIDNQQISTVDDLLAVMQRMAVNHQSEPFNTVLHAIKNIIEPHLGADISKLHPPRA